MKTARTTIELDKELLKKVKQKAIEKDKTLKEVINDALAKEFGGLAKKKKGKRVKIKTFPLGVKGTLRREEIYDWL